MVVLVLKWYNDSHATYCGWLRDCHLKYEFFICVFRSWFEFQTFTNLMPIYHLNTEHVWY